MWTPGTGFRRFACRLSPGISAVWTLQSVLLIDIVLVVRIGTDSQPAECLKVGVESLKDADVAAGRLIGPCSVDRSVHDDFAVFKAVEILVRTAGQHAETVAFPVRTVGRPIIACAMAGRLFGRRDRFRNGAPG